MTATDLAAALIRQHEGLRLSVYVDTTGHRSVGYGRNLEQARGITRAEAEFLLQNDLALAETIAHGFLSQQAWAALNEPRRAVLIDMAHNLGGPRIGKFVQMRYALEAGDYATAAEEMLNSLWADQVGERAWTLATIMETGEMPNGVA